MLNKSVICLAILAFLQPLSLLANDSSKPGVRGVSQVEQPTPETATSTSTSTVLAPEPAKDITTPVMNNATPVRSLTTISNPATLVQSNQPQQPDNPRTNNAIWPAGLPMPGGAIQKPPQVKLPLPGVGVLPGATRVKSNIIRVTENSVEDVTISQAYPNRIATPFPNPRVIDSSGADITKEGGSIYIKLMNSTPAAIFIMGDKPSDPVISLMLKPADIGPQVITLTLDDRLKQIVGQAAEEVPTTVAPNYSGQLTQVLKSVVRGKTPPGFSGGPLPVSVGRMGEHLMLRTEMRYSGRDMEVFSYWITNITNEPLVLDESMFYVSGVRAVAFYPETQLQPNQSTRVLIASETKTSESQ